MSLFFQLVVHGIYAASIYVLLGVGWGLIFSVGRVFHISYGISFAAGAYLSTYVSNRYGLPLVACGLVGVFASAVLGAIFELALYRPLRRRNADRMVMLIASLGMMSFFTAVLSVAFGVKAVTFVGVRDEALKLGAGVIVTRFELISFAISLVSILAFFFFWRRTWGGRLLRAVAASPERALLAGMNVGTARLVAMSIGSAMAGLAGVLLALTEAATLHMILTGLLMATAAVFVGGLGSALGAVVGSVVIALSMNIGVWHLPSSWQQAVAFVILLGFILFRPQGLMGAKVASSHV